jgi:hypothetical protein
MNKGFVYTVVPIGFGVAAICVATLVTTCGRQSDVAAQPKDLGPLHGENPIFTMVQMKPCVDRLAPFCNEWAWCGNSPPAMSEPHKLWNVHVTSDKDGTALVCEWRRSDR